MRMLNIATFALACSLGSTSLHALELIARCPSGITESASVDTRVRKYPLLARLGNPDKRTLVAGTLRLRNDTPFVAPYSNREVLRAAGNEAGAQAYVRSFASHAVDFGYIELAPNQSMKLKVYWPSKLKAGTNASGAIDCIRLRPAHVPPPTNRSSGRVE